VFSIGPPLWFVDLESVDLVLQNFDSSMSWFVDLESVDLIVQTVTAGCWIFSAKYCKYNSFMKTDGSSDGIEDDSNATDFG
jgi:hypothetical protein